MQPVNVLRPSAEDSLTCYCCVTCNLSVLLADNASLLGCEGRGKQQGLYLALRFGVSGAELWRVVVFRSPSPGRGCLLLSNSGCEVVGPLAEPEPGRPELAIRSASSDSSQLIAGTAVRVAMAAALDMPDAGSWMASSFGLHA